MDDNHLESKKKIFRLIINFLYKETQNEFLNNNGSFNIAYLYLLKGIQLAGNVNFRSKKCLVFKSS